MKKVIIIFPMLLVFFFFGCSASTSTRKGTKPKIVVPTQLLKPGESIAIMPFETENALSNFGTQLSDEVTVYLMENIDNIKIVPAIQTQKFLLTANTTVSGIPDMHSIHSIKEGLKCRYLLTGNLFTSIGDVRYTTNYSSRIASGSATVRLIDCDSAVVIWAKHIEDSFQSTSYYTQNGVQSSSYYTDGQLLQQLIKDLAEVIAQYFYEE